MCIMIINIRNVGEPWINLISVGS